MSIFENDEAEDGTRCFIDKSECGPECKAYNQGAVDCNFVLVADKLNAILDQIDDGIEFVSSDAGRTVIGQFLNNVKAKFSV